MGLFDNVSRGDVELADGSFVLRYDGSSLHGNRTFFRARHKRGNKSLREFDEWEDAYVWATTGMLRRVVEDREEVAPPASVREAVKERYGL